MEKEMVEEPGKNFYPKEIVIFPLPFILDKILKRCNFSFPPRESGLLRLFNPFSATVTGRFGMGTVRMGA
jgi:hypothetical protein